MGDNSTIKELELWTLSHSMQEMMKDKCLKSEVNPSRNFEECVKNMLLHENFNQKFLVEKGHNSEN